MIDYDDMKNRVTLVRSKSDAPLTEIVEASTDKSQLFKPLQTPAGESSVAPALKEPCSHVTEESHIDVMMDVEEAYIANDLGVLLKEVILYGSIRAWACFKLY